MTLALEYQGATTGFILGRSRIGHDLLDADATVEWLPALADALNVSVSRGGQRDGLVDSLDVGTMTARFLNALDPTTDDNVRPNTPIRLVERGAVRSPVYRSALATGWPDSWAQRTGSGPWSAALTEVNGLGTGLRGDSGASLRRSVSTRRANRAVFSWTDQALGATAQTYDVVVGGVTAHRFTTAPFPTTRSVTVDVEVIGSVEVRFDWVSGGSGRTSFHSLGLDTLQDAPLFTGVVQDVSMTDDRDGDRNVTITAVDARASLSNTQRYGAVQGGVGHESWVGRINRLRTSAQTSTAEPVVTVASSPFRLRDVVFESTLSNHFDLACNSVGARWWVDRNNVVQFAWGPPTGTSSVLAHFSDEHDEDDAKHVCFADIQLGYDTRNAVNNLSLTNHGRRFDTEQATWVADDQTSVHEDATGIASWGARSASVDTSLFTGTGHEADVVIRAYALLDGAVTPSVRPTSLRFSVADGPHVLAGLDYFSRVTVTRAGATWTCAVVGIQHEIAPLEGHLITLTLREDY